MRLPQDSHQLPPCTAGLTAFLVLKPLTTWLLRRGWTTQPFTAQENTVVQTFAMAMVTSLWILGFGSYLQAMDQQTYVNIGGASTPGNYASDVSNPCGPLRGALCSLVSCLREAMSQQGDTANLRSEQRPMLTRAASLQPCAHSHAHHRHLTLHQGLGPGRGVMLEPGHALGRIRGMLIAGLYCWTRPSSK